jgi:glycosyltransferase involved in cell wall biosynthesis
VHNPKTTKLFCQRTNQQLQKRYKPNDLILCFFGQDHQEATVNDKNWIVVEPAIGYRPECIFAPYRVFTSYAIMHYFYGLNNMLSTPSWFDTVIPNAFTPSEFTFQEHKQDYLLYLGRLNWDKGIDLAIQVAERAQRRLLIAGPGSLKDLNYTSIPKHVELVGYADVEKRRNLLKDAYALIAPTYYIEPFGNIVIEAAMSGTPVITTDWGGFCDTVIPGVTGYRCKNFHGFVHSVDEIKKIKPQNCRNWAMSNYSDEIVHDRFDRYFQYLTSRDFYYAEN